MQVSKLPNNTPIVISVDKTIHNHTPNHDLCDPQIARKSHQQPTPRNKKVEHKSHQIKKTKRLNKQIKPMTDEEFNKLLKNLRKPKNTSKGEMLCQKSTHKSLALFVC